VHYLHMVHARDARGHWFINILFVSGPRIYQSISLYLMLDDEIFLNALLSTGLLQSTSSHLFWNQDLELYEYLKSSSHKWKVLPPLAVGNTSMSTN
jgi:hypothetical protein